MKMINQKILDTLQDMYRIPMKYKEYKLFIKGTQKLNIFLMKLKI